MRTLFHIPVEAQADTTVKKELYYVGPLNDEGNTKVTNKIRNNIPKCTRQELDGYMDYLMGDFNQIG